jgi:hypothetical protein
LRDYTFNPPHRNIYIITFFPAIAGAMHLLLSQHCLPPIPFEEILLFFPLLSFNPEQPMQSRFIIAATLILSILLSAGHAQISDHFQGVGEDFGRAWLKNRMAQNQTQAENSGGGLWSWGGAPKGSIIMGGRLVPDPYSIWKSFNYTYGWLGEVYVDPHTGYPVYSYIDPYTGMQIYFYMDPEAGKPVYFYVDPTTGKPVYINKGIAYGFSGYGSSLSPYGYDFYPQPSPYSWPGSAYNGTGSDNFLGMV